MKRTLLAMAVLVTSVFGVTGCGSDENTQLETENTQLETEITQLQTRVDALEEQAKSRVTNLTLDQTDDAVQFQSRSKNAAPEPTEVPEAPEASGASDASSEADCDRRSEFLDLLNRLDRRDLHRLDLLPSSLHSWGLPEIREMGKSFYDARLRELDLLDELNLDNLDHLYDTLFDELELLDDLDLRNDLRGVHDQCDSMWMEMMLPPGDDVDGG